jgi:hypothetical protein
MTKAINLTRSQHEARGLGVAVDQSLAGPKRNIGQEKVPCVYTKMDIRFNCSARNRNTNGGEGALKS